MLLLVGGVCGTVPVNFPSLPFVVGDPRRWIARKVQLFEGLAIQDYSGDPGEQLENLGKLDRLGDYPVSGPGTGGSL